MVSTVSNGFERLVGARRVPARRVAHDPPRHVVDGRQPPVDAGRDRLGVEQERPGPRQDAAVNPRLLALRARLAHLGRVERGLDHRHVDGLRRRILAAGPPDAHAQKVGVLGVAEQLAPPHARGARAVLVRRLEHELRRSEQLLPRRLGDDAPYAREGPFVGAAERARRAEHEQIVALGGAGARVAVALRVDLPGEGHRLPVDVARRRGVVHGRQAVGAQELPELALGPVVAGARREHLVIVVDARAHGSVGEHRVDDLELHREAADGGVRRGDGDDAAVGAGRLVARHVDVDPHDAVAACSHLHRVGIPRGGVLDGDERVGNAAHPSAVRRPRPRLPAARAAVELAARGVPHVDEVLHEALDGSPHDPRLRRVYERRAVRVAQLRQLHRHALEVRVVRRDHDLERDRFVAHREQAHRLARRPHRVVLAVLERRVARALRDLLPVVDDPRRRLRGGQPGRQQRRDPDDPQCGAASSHEVSVSFR